jgi:hypothetical protein
MMVGSRWDVKVAIIARFEVLTVVLGFYTCQLATQLRMFWMGIVLPASGSSSEHSVTSQKTSFFFHIVMKASHHIQHKVIDL